MGLDAAIIGAVVAMSMGLVEIIKKLIEKRSANHTTGLTQAEHDWLRNLHQMHNQFDEDGAPKWYVPRSWARVQEEMLEGLSEMSQNQKEIVRILKDLDNHVKDSGE